MPTAIAVGDVLIVAVLSVGNEANKRSNDDFDKAIGADKQLPATRRKGEFQQEYWN